MQTNLEVLNPKGFTEGMKANWNAITNGGFQRGMRTNKEVVNSFTGKSKSLDKCAVIRRQINNTPGITKYETAEILKAEGCYKKKTNCTKSSMLDSWKKGLNPAQASAALKNGC